MIVKRYYAKDMQEAMATIRAELGPDAVILSSKPIRKKGLAGLFQRKELEVIAAYEPRLESPRVREERESATVQAAIQAVQDAQNRIVTPPAQPPNAAQNAAHAPNNAPKEIVIDMPPPSAGQPLGPIEGRSRAQARPLSQNTHAAPHQSPPQGNVQPPRAARPQSAAPAQNAAQAQGAAPSPRAQVQHDEPVTQQAKPRNYAQTGTPPAQSAPAAPVPEAPIGQSVAAQAAARYSQTAGLSRDGGAQPTEQERPQFTREPQQTSPAYNKPRQAPPSGGKLGDDLVFEVEDLEAVQVASIQRDAFRAQPQEPQAQRQPPVAAPMAETAADPAPVVQPASAPIVQPVPVEPDPIRVEEYEIADPAAVALATPIVTAISGEESARLDALDQKLNALGSLIESFARKYEFIRHDNDYKYDAQIEPYLFKLLDNDVEQELAHALARAAQESCRAGQQPRHALEELLRGVIGPTTLPTLTQGRPVVLFMGPTGVGKTTTLVKLATMCSVRDKRKVGLINTDTYRIAAQEQLRTYAEILDVPLKVVYTPSDLSSAIAEMADRDVIFVDTAGKRPGDPQHRTDMMELMEAAGEDAVPLLAVSAPTSQRAMRELFEHYDFLPEYSVILTKTDETSGWGAAVNACHLSGMPIAYLTGGQSVPDDIEQADADELLRRLLR